jgi:hypothetical protein
MDQEDEKPAIQDSSTAESVRRTRGALVRRRRIANAILAKRRKHGQSDAAPPGSGGPADGCEQEQDP